MQKNDFDELTQPILKMAKSLNETAKLMEMIRENNEELKQFNFSFGSFLHGIAGTNLFNEQLFRTNEDNSHMDTEIARNNTTTPYTTETPAMASTSSIPSKPTSRLKANTKRISTDKTMNDARKRKKPAEQTITKEQQQKIQSIIDKMPLEIREDPDYLNNARAIIRLFFLKLDGFTLKDLAEESRVPQYRVTKCVNALIHAKIVAKAPSKHKGQYSRFQLSTGWTKVL